MSTIAMPRTAGRRARPMLLVLVAVLAALATGCQAAEQDSARETAQEFVSAVGSDAQRACELLAPDTVESLESLRPEGCQEALPSLELPDADVTDVQVWGDAAQARSGQDTLFLRELDDGWHVVAAGCQEQEGGAPYQCVLQSS